MDKCIKLSGRLAYLFEREEQVRKSELLSEHQGNLLTTGSIRATLT
jgi:hypothetical protein